MPVQSCTKDGKPGWKWGKDGKCYKYRPGDAAASARAKSKAAAQGRAVKASQARKGKK